MILAFLLAGAVLLPNGDFEQGLGNWKFHGPNKAEWQVVEGVGRPPQPGQRPTKALVFERKEGDPKSGWIGADVPAKAGCVYRISAWIAVDKITNTMRRPSIAIAIGHPWYCGTQWAPKNQEVDQDGWHKVSAVTPPMPSGTDHFTFCLSVHPDAVGRAFYDDLTVELVGERVISDFACVSPGRQASGGKVTFVADIAPDTSRYPAKDIRAVLRWKGHAAAGVLESLAHVTADVDVADFAMGRNDVTLSLETTDGAVIAQKSIDFTRTEPDTKPRKTKFDAHRRLLVDGKVVYPLGIYWHPDEDSEEAMDLLARSPFNFVVDYDKAMTRAKLDRFHRRGIGVLASLAHCHPFITYRPKGLEATDAACDAYARRLVAELKDHPALWGWYMIDEPPRDRFPALLTRYRLVRELDPEHICYNVTWTPADTAPLSESCDVIGIDTYPIGQLRATEEQKYLPEVRQIFRECDETVRGAHGRMPVWQVPQAFSWGRDHRDPMYWWMRFPTREEYVAQVWQEIAGGADGMCFWLFTDIYREWKKGNRGAFYDLCAAVEDARRLAPVLLSTDEPPTLSGTDGDLKARAFRYDGKAYVVACNLTWQRRAATLTLAGQWQKPWTEVGAPARLEDGNRLLLDLPPIGVSVIRLEPVSQPSLVKATVETSLGEIVLELDAEKAPVTVSNFVAYAEAGHYDGTVFHRVINGFMIQGGGFTADMTQKETCAPIRNEATNGLKNLRGTIAMARTMVVDSATSQFFINLRDNAFLDHNAPNPRGYGYAVFGRVTKGLDVVDRIATVRTGAVGSYQDVPLEPVVIRSVKIGQ